MKTELQNYTYRLILIAFINFQKIADQDTTNDKRYCASLKHTLNAFIKFYQNKFGTLDGSVNSVYKNCQDWIEKKPDNYNAMDDETKKQYLNIWLNGIR